jgi:hypothetical protein
MSALMWIHIAGGMIALLTGAVAVAVRKGGRVHGSAGTWFCASMLVLGVTASILGPLKTPPDSPLGGMLVCYFVATAWMAARRRDGTAGMFEMLACLFVLGAAAATAWAAVTGAATTPAGAGPVFVFAGACLLAGLGDLRTILRRRLTPAQRLSRHLWRMCVAFFIATGSFFLGQQDVLPQAVRGSPVLFVLAFAPFAVMLFWLARLRFVAAIAGGHVLFRERLRVTAPERR